MSRLVTDLLTGSQSAIDLLKGQPRRSCHIEICVVDALQVELRSGSPGMDSGIAESSGSSRTVLLKLRR